LPAAPRTRRAAPASSRCRPGRAADRRPRPASPAPAARRRWRAASCRGPRRSPRATPRSNGTPVRLGWGRDQERIRRRAGAYQRWPAAFECSTPVNVSSAGRRPPSGSQARGEPSVPSVVQ
jgi:hypothetical protein